MTSEKSEKRFSNSVKKTYTREKTTTTLKRFQNIHEFEEGRKVAKKVCLEILSKTSYLNHFHKTISPTMWTHSDRRYSGLLIKCGAYRRSLT